MLKEITFDRCLRKHSFMFMQRKALHIEKDNAGRVYFEEWNLRTSRSYSDNFMRQSGNCLLKVHVKCRCRKVSLHKSNSSRAVSFDGNKSVRCMRTKKTRQLCKSNKASTLVPKILLLVIISAAIWQTVQVSFLPARMLRSLLLPVHSVACAKRQVGRSSQRHYSALSRQEQYQPGDAHGEHKRIGRSLAVDFSAPSRIRKCLNRNIRLISVSHPLWRFPRLASLRRLSKPALLRGVHDDALHYHQIALLRQCNDAVICHE